MLRSADAWCWGRTKQRSPPQSACSWRRLRAMKDGLSRSKEEHHLQSKDSTSSVRCTRGSRWERAEVRDRSSTCGMDSLDTWTATMTTSSSMAVLVMRDSSSPMGLFPAARRFTAYTKARLSQTKRSSCRPGGRCIEERTSSVAARPASSRSVEDWSSTRWNKAAGAWSSASSECERQEECHG